MKKAIIVLLLLLFTATASWAAGNKNDLAYLGYDELETTAAVGASDSIVVFESNIPKKGGTVGDIAALANVVEYVSDTEKTLTADDDGKTFVFTSASATEVELPIGTSITEGITLVNGDGASALSVDPYAGDTVKFGTVVLDAGDKITADGDSGESATVRGSGTSVYTTVTGNWADGGS